jgi:hypothetical protein
VFEGGGPEKRPKNNERIQQRSKGTPEVEVSGKKDSPQQDKKDSGKRRSKEHDMGSE